MEEKKVKAEEVVDQAKQKMATDTIAFLMDLRQEVRNQIIDKCANDTQIKIVYATLAADFITQSLTTSATDDLMRLTGFMDYVAKTITVLREGTAEEEETKNAPNTPQL